jgi:hypothetical protein
MEGIKFKVPRVNSLEWKSLVLLKMGV